MNQITIIALLCVAYQLFDSVSSKQVPRCNATRHEEADVCMQKMFLIGDRSQRFRETLPQMKNYCRQISDLQNCVKRFSRECLPELGRQVTNLLLYGVTKVNRQYCGSEKGMRRFNEIAKCGNHELNRKHDCMDSFLNQLRLVEKRTDDEMVEMRIHYVCCYFSQFTSCVEETFHVGNSKQKCPTEKIKQNVIDLIGGYADDALDMVCGEFGNNDSKCDELLRQNSTNTSNKKDDSKRGKLRTSKTANQKAVAKSILPYFVNIFGKL